MARFVLVLAGAHEVALGPGIYRVGRAPECEIRLTASSVSRRHATLRVDRERVMLEEDAGNRNGTWVNDERVRGKVPLESGDRLRFGEAELSLLDRDLLEEQFGGTATRPIAKPDTRRLDALAALSPREREVLVLLARGHTQREIGESLGVSAKTVETYRARIADKLELRTRAELVEFAIESGVLGAPQR